MSRPENDGLPFLRSDDLFIREHAGVRDYVWIGERLGRTPESVRARARLLGVQRSVGVVSMVDKERDEEYMLRVKQELGGVL